MKYLGHTINLNKNDVFLSLFFALFSIFFPVNDYEMRFSSLSFRYNKMLE